MRRCLVQDAAAGASRAVYLPLLRVQETDGFGVWDISHLSAIQASRNGRLELLCVCQLIFLSSRIRKRLLLSG